MTSMQLFQGFSGVDAELLASVEQPPVRERAPAGKRIWLIAAVVALAALLVGCAAYYALSMKRVKIGESAGQRDYTLVDGVYEKDPHTVSTSILTLSGLEGSNAYKACADYYAFQEEYDRNMEQMIEAGTLPEDFWDTYADTMDAKAAELAEQYHLKPTGNLLNFRTTRNLCDALGVERFVRNSQDVSIDVDQGFCRDSGNFFVLLRFAFPEDQGYEVTYTSGALYWNRQDTFSREYFTLEDRGNWVERNYTTSAGNTVLILTSPSQERGYILCNRGDALMTLWLDANPEILSEDAGVVSAEYLHMTEGQLNMVADALDFAIQPNIPTQADVDAQAAPPQEATQNGYTLKLKSVETDGYVARVVVGITAPEDVDIESLNISDGGMFFGTPDRESMGGSGAFNDVTDGDGLANTKDLVAEFTVSFLDGLRPFELGATWDLDITDLYVDQWLPTSRVLTEGEWHFSIIFDETNTDYDALELISSPITATACTGWSLDGKDVLMEFPISSFKLRKFSSEITQDTAAETEEQRRAAPSADFYGWRDHFAYAVMKDGTKIQLLERTNCDPIDLAQVDYVLLADGTKLPVPQTQ
mgnify:CR=1 FL=1